MPLIRWSRIALDELVAIEAWLETHRSAAFADRTLTDIRTKARLLETFPHAGREEGRVGRILRVTGTPYLIFYRVLDDEAVQVLRIFHERQNRTGA